jgi:hypothetical protein
LFGILGYIIFFGSAGVVIIGYTRSKTLQVNTLKHGSFQLSILENLWFFR